MQTIDLRLLDVQMEQLSHAIAEKQRLAAMLGGGDIPHALRKNKVMTDMTREELSLNLSAIEERMDKRIERMEYDAEKRVLDYKSELALRDEQLRRELDLRQESFRAEQAARDKALDEKFSGFLAAQAERDKSSEYRFGRIESDLSSIKGDLKTVNSDVHEIRRTLAKYMGGIAVGAAITGVVIGAAAKFIFS